jgi:hypothetical protein
MLSSLPSRMRFRALGANAESRYLSEKILAMSNLLHKGVCFLRSRPKSFRTLDSQDLSQVFRVGSDRPGLEVDQLNLAKEVETD